MQCIKLQNLLVAMKEEPFHKILLPKFDTDFGRDKIHRISLCEERGVTGLGETQSKIGLKPYFSGARPYNRNSCHA